MTTDGLLKRRVSLLILAWLFWPWWMRGLFMLLRVPILGTDRATVAERSDWQYGEHPPGSGYFATSPLGMLNGYVPRYTGRYVTLHYESGFIWPAWPLITLRKPSW